MLEGLTVASVVSTNKTEKERKESDKYLLSAHHMSGVVLNNEQSATSQSSLSERERTKQVITIEGQLVPGKKYKGQWE